MDGQAREHVAMQESFSPAPVEEFRKDMREGACCMISKEEPQDPEFPEVKKGGSGPADPGDGYVMAPVYKWRKKAEAAGPVISTAPNFPTGKYSAIHQSSA
jgi:hypothetical protein